MSSERTGRERGAADPHAASPTWAWPSRIQRVVVVRKQSAIERQRRAPDARLARVLASPSEAADRLYSSHLAHESAADLVCTALASQGIRVEAVASMTRAAAQRADMVVTVGGDGTFLRASHCVGTQQWGPPMLGVNSAPETSIGFYCAVDACAFAPFLERILAGTVPLRPLWRMRVRINDKVLPDFALNDVLVAHRIPAETTRYVLHADGHHQRQKSSGIWVATAAGSTGAIRSAGGAVLPLDDRRIQFRVRELFPLSVQEERPLIGGVVDGLRIESLTMAGLLSLDGAHRRVRFGFGDVLAFEPAPTPLPWIAPAEAEERRARVTARSAVVLRAGGPLL